MKRALSLLAFISVLCAGCGVTRIVTETPYHGDTGSYRTTVRTVRANSVTTDVSAANEDISLYLDLQGIGAAFSQASTVKEFESLLNNSSYMLSDLDLNNDGYVDYLRVLETLDGTTHVFLIQAVLGEDVYQDVATLVAEVPSTTSYHVQIIGAPFLYGPDYIVEPVYYTRPAIFVSFGAAAYVAWRSPWRWNFYPKYYSRPAPVHLSHYQAYIGTYMRNHRYCHEVTYVNVYHYTNYNVISRGVQRNDYFSGHPERSFNSRVTNIQTAVSRTDGQKPLEIRNARDIRTLNESTKQVTTTTGRQARNSGSTFRATAVNKGTGKAVDDASAPRRKANAVKNGVSSRTTKTGGEGPAKAIKHKKDVGSNTGADTGRVAQRKANRQSGQSVRPATTERSRVQKSGSSSTRVRKTSSTGEKTTYRRK